MKVLVTGASGFIGKSLSRKIQENNTVISQLRSTIIPAGSANSFVSINIDSESNWRDCLNNISVVVHLAAVAHNHSTDINYINEVNVEGSLNLARQAADSGVKRFIFISSIGVFGDHAEKLFCEESLEFPHSEYAKSKLKAEQGLRKIAAETGLEVVIIRPTLVYGKNAPGNFGLLLKLVKKLPCTPFGLVKNRRSFISVDNLCNFIDVCISHPQAANEAFVISDDQVVSTPELMSAMALGLGKNIYHLPIPVNVLFFFGWIFGKSKQVEQLVGNLEVDCSKAKALLGWKSVETMVQAMSKLK